jgi:beta-glucosidase
MKKRMMVMSLVVLSALFLFTCTRYQFPFQNPNLPLEKRVNDLVSRLTLEEKVSQMMDVAPGIERLGIPPYNWWSEALHGVAFAGVATVFPQAIGLGATWDTDLMLKVADVISTEARAKHHESIRNKEYGRFQGLTIFSPNINIFRDPRWGRGQETYGEDPYLMARMGVQFVKGLQGDDPKYLKTIATVKHYAVHSGPEPMRHGFNAVVDKRDLYETYLPAFEAGIREGKSWSIMGAYSAYLGYPCNASPLLLQDILRDRWGFKGYVVSDCGAINDIYVNHKFVPTQEEAAAIAVKTGCDLECGDAYTALTTAVKQGLITEAEIDVSVRRLFEARFRLGMFDPPEKVKYAQIPFSENDSPAHRQLAVDAARESIVLLKNQKNTLPLSKELRSIIVMGPNADRADAMYGNYNGIPSKAVTPLQGIKSKLGQNTRILFAQGCDWVDANPVTKVIKSNYLFTPEGQHGLTVEYFNNVKLEGPPVRTQIDTTINFQLNLVAPAPGVNKEYYSIRYTGAIMAPITSEYLFTVTGDDGYRLYINNKLVIENWREQGPTPMSGKCLLKGGEKASIKVEYYNSHYGAVLELAWAPLNKDYVKEAVTMAQHADAVIFVGGISSRLEGEEMRVPFEGFQGGDRTSIDLPQVQEHLLKTLKQAGKPIVFVNMSGSAMAMNWEDENVDAIVQAWYPGEEGGTAIADVLFGDYNPAGRLPVTFYKSVNDLPPFEDYNMKGRTYRYFNGEALYPFGYGLSYTTFAYSNLQIPKSVTGGHDCQVSVDVQNTGQKAGDEVVELYLSHKNASTPVAIRALQGFKRMHLNPGEKQNIVFTLTTRQLSLINNDDKRVVEPGLLQVTVGGCQPLPKPASTSNYVTGSFEVTGAVVEVN